MKYKRATIVIPTEPIFMEDLPPKLISWLDTPHTQFSNSVIYLLNCDLIQFVAGQMIAGVCLGNNELARKCFDRLVKEELAETR
jgi:hypothetical protein